MAQAIRHIPQSVKIWVKAVELESETAAKKKVLRKGELVADSWSVQAGCVEVPLSSPSSGADSDIGATVEVSS